MQKNAPRRNHWPAVVYCSKRACKELNKSEPSIVAYNILPSHHIRIIARCRIGFFVYFYGLWTADGACEDFCVTLKGLRSTWNIGRGKSYITCYIGMDSHSSWAHLLRWYQEPKARRLFIDWRWTLFCQFKFFFRGLNLLPHTSHGGYSKMKPAPPSTCQ